MEVGLVSHGQEEWWKMAGEGQEFSAKIIFKLNNYTSKINFVQTVITAIMNLLLPLCATWIRKNSLVTLLD